MRKYLISDLESYSKKLLRLYNQEGKVVKIEFFEFSSRIFYLRKDDFDSEEKYNFFLRFYNQPQRRADRYLLEKGFKDDYLNGAKLMWVCDYFGGILNRIK